MEAGQRDLLTRLLSRVSRSFYLTLRVLPRAIRPQISLAYLLARATDTIADTRVVPRAKRVLLLRELQSLTRAPDLGPLAEQQALTAERELLQRLPECLELLDSFSAADRRLVQHLLSTIIQGQIFDLERFPGETEKELVALRDDAELDHYTYLVAGCVGEFWTEICRLHLRGLSHWDSAQTHRGVRFGKGLQLINILRDIPADLRRGRCYLPVAGPYRLLEPAGFEFIREEFHRWLDRTVEHLDAAWQYVQQIPARHVRLRLACVWPIWIGQKTIARLRHGNPLASAQPVKITRGEVYLLMLDSAWRCWVEPCLSRRFQQLRQMTTR
ncbi:MAG: squalene/phytoene synthase family protein [Verrucomicrobiae bacterium]|nr:squalene/phytoene synthase family protein [Verrucomicrobiae bacterium]